MGDFWLSAAVDATNRSHGLDASNCIIALTCIGR
jgi:hypothetical protein